MHAEEVDLGIWKLTDGQPVRFEPHAVELESHLESWLERDGSLVQGGLVIVGKQVRTEAGPLDLLALDQFGRWSVIEIKRNTVRRETIAQAAEYAACLAEMDTPSLRTAVEKYLQSRGMSLKPLLTRLNLTESVFERPRDIQVFVVGTDRDPGFERLAKYFQFQGNPVNAVTFSVFQGANGERLLMRKLSELDAGPPPTAVTKQGDPEQLALAAKNGIGEEFRILYEAATRHDLYPKRYARSLMYAPQTNRNRVLICVWAVPTRKKMRVYVATPAFAEFFPLSRRDAEKLIGPQRDATMNVEEARKFAADLDRLFAKIASNA